MNPQAALRTLIDRADHTKANTIRCYVPNGMSDWQYVIWLDRQHHPNPMHGTTADRYW